MARVCIEPLIAARSGSVVVARTLNGAVGGGVIRIASFKLGVVE